MSIVFCSACGKKISDKTTLCGHCGFQRGEVSEEQLARFGQRKARDAVYRWKMSSYAVLTAFVAGFGWYWWESDGYQQATSSGPFIVMAVSALAYLVVRAFLFQARRKLKLLQQATP